MPDAGNGPSYLVGVFARSGFAQFCNVGAGVSLPADFYLGRPASMQQLSFILYTAAGSYLSC